MFWTRRRLRRIQEQEGAKGDGASGNPDSLLRVRVYTARGVGDGWVVVTDRRRLSDLLNTEDLLTLSRVGGAVPPADAWTDIEVERVLVISAPPPTGDRRLRRHRIRRPLLAETAHYSVRGWVHLIPGIELDPYLGRTRQRFLPITGATVTSSANDALRDEHAAVLINVGHTGQRLKLEVIA